MTPHISAKKEDIAKIVFMPGDPLRAKFIAENFLTEYKLINSTRNMLGYTGYYKGERVTVMGSGMGMPSIGIYSYELYKFYDVESIIRIGSCGAYRKNLSLFDTVLVESAYSESSFVKTYGFSNENIMQSNESLNKTLKVAAKRNKLELKTVKIHSSDVFYRMNSKEYVDISKKYDLSAVEMESFALFSVAKSLGKKASCLLTVSDSLVTHEVTTSLEREQAFTGMMKIALESLLIK